MTETTTIDQKDSNTVLRKEAFEVQLNIIDAKYVRWFGERVHPFTGETDHVHNYYRYTTTREGKTQLYLKDGLPIEIAKDCRQAFEAIFPN